MLPVAGSCCWRIYCVFLFTSSGDGNEPSLLESNAAPCLPTVLCAELIHNRLCLIWCFSPRLLFPPRVGTVDLHVFCPRESNNFSYYCLKAYFCTPSSSSSSATLEQRALRPHNSYPKCHALTSLEWSSLSSCQCLCTYKMPCNFFCLLLNVRLQWVLPFQMSGL